MNLQLLHSLSFVVQPYTMQSINQYVWIIPLLPCLTAAILGLGLISTKNATKSQRLGSALLSIGALLVTMLLSMIVLWEQLMSDSAYRQLVSWIKIDTFVLEIGCLVDPLSAIMLVLVTTVGVLVMIYTHGYMSHDQGYVRFFAYLSLFTASMLGLVLSPNLVQVYAFWELVGMCSYLLVGFWFNRPSAAYACQKAFITNRVGDFGLLLGILALYWLTGSFEFDIVAPRAHQLLVENSANTLMLTLCCVLLFLGPIAKSAQFPLHVWLPDAMEGPTPISALIHAATMVAAGVYLVARLLPLFQEVPIVMDIVAWTGGITAVLGATVALAQKDLKKGLAYSTMSQLGYMILALGVGSYQAGLFHLITHAYSKALLFLGSGSVIHGIEPVVGYNPNQSQNMNYMGGLRSYMPITGSTFLIGTLSLCGVPPFACFWSKDEILADAWHKLPVLGLLAWLTAGLTAFYMFRMYFITFEGNFRGSSLMSTKSSKQTLSGNKIDDVFVSSNQTKHDISLKTGKDLNPHESSNAMTIPLIVLTIPTILIGFIGAPLPNGLPGSSILSHWLYLDHTELAELSTNGWTEFAITALPSVTIGLVGTFVAWIVYGPHVERLKNNYTSVDPSAEGWAGILLNSIYNWSLRRAYIDEIYDQTFVWATRSSANALAWFDQWTIDGIVNVGGLFTLLGGEGTRYTEGGRTSAYIFVLGIGLVFVMIAAVLFNFFSLS
jgi:NAD(P)H-quinone oxidoreductase subunit 5